MLLMNAVLGAIVVRLGAENAHAHCPNCSKSVVDF